MRKSTILAVIGLVSLLLAVVAPSAVAQTPAATSALVSVGSPTNQHPQNAQNEPSLAVDASRPTVLAAGVDDRRRVLVPAWHLQPRGRPVVRVLLVRPGPHLGPADLPGADGR